MRPSSSLRGVRPPPFSILRRPELQVYLADLGTRPDDLVLAAEVDGRVVGAVWSRIMEDYGHVDDMTPSLAISLLPQYRGAGIGTALMRELLSLLRRKGYPVCLSRSSGKTGRWGSTGRRGFPSWKKRERNSLWSALWAEALRPGEKKLPRTITSGAVFYGKTPFLWPASGGRFMNRPYRGLRHTGTGRSL